MNARTRNRSLTVAALLLVFGCMVPAPVSAASQYDDALYSFIRENAGLGRVITPATSGNTGAYTYEYPLKLPPGRGLASPRISLTYSSQSHNDSDIFGYGWQISLPYIQRLNKTGFGALYSSTSPSTAFYSSMSGELATTTSTLYTAKIDDGSTLKYTFSAGVWSARDKNGTVYDYGLAPTARIEDPTDSSRVYRWYLSDTIDANGNVVRYTYTKDGGQVYPQSVRYGALTSTSTDPFVVTFTTSPRTTATTTSAEAGFPVTTASKVDGITISFAGGQVHQYDFGYATGDNHGRLLLSSITETGQAEGSSTKLTLLPTTFSYSTSNPTYASTTWTMPIENSISGAAYDRGVSLLDVNGDGRADLVQAYSVYNTRTGGQDPYSHVWLNNGSGWTLAPSYVVPCTATYFDGHNYLLDGSGRILDVNGDALPDYDCNGSIFINNGQNWVNDPTWTGGLQTSSGGYDQGVRFGDVNGDGLVDMVQSFDFINYYGNHIITQIVNRNTGHGWVQDSSYTIPAGIYFNNNLHYGGGFGDLVDVNGDGLADIVNGGDVYLNTGKGWVYDLGWSLPMLDGAMSTRMADVNGDGLPDMVNASSIYGPYPSDPVVHWSTRDVYLNTGHGWYHDTSRNFPVPFQQSTMDTGVRFGDINGDGVNDIVIDGWGQMPNDYVWSYNEQEQSQSLPPDLLIGTNESSGSSIAVAYKNSPQYTSGTTTQNANLPTPLVTVNTITTNPGVGPTTKVTYDYSGGSFYYAGPFDRRVAGFNRISSTDPSGAITNTFFHQGNGVSTTTYEEPDDQAKIGKPYRVELWNNGNTLEELVTNAWMLLPHYNGGMYVLLGTTTTQTFDGNVSHRDTATEYQYENIAGTLRKKILWGEVTAALDGTFTDVGTDKRTVSYNYATASGGYPYQVDDETLTDQNGVWTSETKTYYDGFNTSFGFVQKGNPSMVQRLKSPTTWASTQTQYNASGLPTTLTDGRGNQTFLTYDPYNLYPATSKNALNQVTSYLYDYSSGKPTQVTDPNGLITNTVYDPLDRVIAKYEPDTASSSPLVQRSTYAYVDTTMPRRMQSTDYLSASTSVSTFTYLDGLGRTLETRSQTEVPGQYNVHDSAYDNRGLLAKDTLPYFDVGSSYRGISYVPSQSMLTNYSYDAQKRPTLVSNVNATVSYSYDDWTATTTDADGHPKGQTKDAFGNLIAVTEKNGSVYGVTSYAYNTLNKLAKLTDAMGNIRTFLYDALGRRTSAQDLHTPSDATFGTTTWAYDDVDNVTQMTDAKAQTVAYTYDALNRVLGEDYTAATGTDVAYTYDTCLLGIGHVCGVSTNAASTTNTYNALGLLASESKTIASTTYITSYQYDRLGNQTQLTLPDASQIAYTYNLGGQLDSVSVKPAVGGGWTPVVTTIDYAPNGKVALKAFANNLNSTYTYDPYKLYRLTHILTMASSTNIATTAPAYQDIAYTYDPVGNITRIDDASKTGAAKSVVYSYDDLNRLTSAFITVGTTSPYNQSFTYNKIGDLLSKSDSGTYTYSNLNYENPHAPSTINGVQQTYDTNGNLLTDAAKSFTYLWDYRNRMTQSVVGSATSTYAYDYTNERIRQTTGGQTTVYPNKNWYATLGVASTTQMFGNGELLATLVTASTTIPATPTSTPMLGSVSTSITSNGSSGALTKTWLHTVGNGPNRLLVVAIDSVRSSPNKGALSTVTFNGVALTRAGGTTNSTAACDVYYLANPPSGAGTTTVSFAAGTDSVKIAAADFTGVKQSSPLVLSQSGSGSSGNPGASVVTSANQLVLTTLSRTAATPVTTTHAVLMNDPTNNLGITSYQVATSSSVTETYTGNASARWCLTSAVFIPASGAPAYSSVASTLHFVHGDQLDGTNVITNASGTPEEVVDYFPFGGTHMDTQTGFNESRKYAGTIHDDATNLEYMSARYYSGTRGQFLSEDPVFWGNQNLSDPQTLNSYLYANNNPITNSDPTGLSSSEAVALKLQTQIAQTQLNLLKLQLAQFVQDTAGNIGNGIGNPVAGAQTAANKDLPTYARISGGIGGAIGTALLPIAFEEQADVQGAKLVPTVLEHKVAGDAFRDAVAKYLEAQGKVVEKEVTKMTPFGVRRVDLQVSDQAGNILGGVETKLNNSAYLPSQRAKDAYLTNVEGYIVNLIRGSSNP